jgi:hypothetical protein
MKNFYLQTHKKKTTGKELFKIDDDFVQEKA